MKKHMLFAALSACTIAALAAAVSAAEPDSVSVIADGYPYTGMVAVYNDTAYVSLREFSAAMDNAVVSWDAETETAHVETDALTVSATENGQYIEANGRLLWCEYGTFTNRDGVMLVPLTTISKAFGFDHTWDGATDTVYLTRETAAITPASEYYDADEVYWLSRIIHAEAQGEPFAGKLAVGEVVLNRVEDAEFPETVYGVIFDNASGVQFTPTVNGAIDNTPNADSVAAAKICLEGVKRHDDILYFLNPTIATSFWIPENRTYVCTIGSHDFYE